jgi:hypothetical protein
VGAGGETPSVTTVRGRTRVEPAAPGSSTTGRTLRATVGLWLSVALSSSGCKDACANVGAGVATDVMRWIVPFLVCVIGSGLIRLEAARRYGVRTGATLWDGYAAKWTGETIAGVPAGLLATMWFFGWGAVFMYCGTRSGSS